MRLIGTLNDERQALKFSLFLHKKGIPHQLEVLTNTDWGSSQYGSSQCLLWVLEEDQMEEALHWYHLFLENPFNPEFDVTRTTPSQPAMPISPMPNFHPESSDSDEDSQAAKVWDRQPMRFITRALLISCCLLFFIVQFQTPFIDTKTGKIPSSIFSSSVQRALLYDYPLTYDLIHRFITLYGYQGLEDTQDLPLEGKRLAYRIEHTPFWPGLYTIIQKNGFQSIASSFLDTPTFEKIRQGELWRLVSPILLHADLFHLFFNMLWLIVLGKQVEQRLGPWRYILFILLIAVFSNTLQYIVGGPNFIGLSGVLCGMLTFIWVRQRVAPWEGYQLDRLSILFIVLFILGMALLQIIAFFIGTIEGLEITTGIANTAHLAGAALGLLFGRLHFFSWRQT